jgi:hypothetical protein
MCACPAGLRQGPEISKYASLGSYVQRIMASQGRLVLFRGFFLSLGHRLCSGGVVLALLLQYPDAAFAFENVVS